MNDPKSFLQSLFDFSFESFIVPKIIRVIYTVALAIVGLQSLGLLMTAFFQSAVIGLFTLIFAPLFFLFMAVVMRSYCELILVQFSLLQNVERISQHLTGGTGPLSGGGEPLDGRSVVHAPSQDGAGASRGATPSHRTPADTPPSTSTPPQQSGSWGDEEDSSTDGWN